MKNQIEKKKEKKRIFFAFFQLDNETKNSQVFGCEKVKFEFKKKSN